MNKTLTLIMMVLILAAVSVVAEDWCYQPLANETSCGDQTIGNYSTNDSTVCNIAVYSKPSSATNNSIWQVEGDFFGYHNLTIPTECWNADSFLTLESQCIGGMGGPEIDWGCYDENSTYYTIYHDSLGDPLSEVMWWDNTTASCTSDYVCIGYGDCVAGNQSCTGVWDQNDCMVSYTGNYSEFTPQACDPDQYTCFQQFANVSTCGGQSVGYYSISNALFDGDWSSYMVASAFQFGLYPRPENATTNSFIMFRYGDGTWVNFSIPGECWIPNFKFGPSYYAGTGSYFCWDSGGMNRQFSGGWAMGNDTFFEQGVFWDICNPNWNCTGYDSCLENNTQLCNNVTDLNTCDLSYSGDYSEFVPQVCDFCTPNWNCSLFGNCTANVSQCLAVNDLNVCNESFTGNLTDYDENCTSPPPITGYVPAFESGDLAGLTIDTMAQAVLEVIALLGVIVAVVVVVYAAGKIKKIGR